MSDDSDSKKDEVFITLEELLEQAEAEQEDVDDSDYGSGSSSDGTGYNKDAYYDHEHDFDHFFDDVFDDVFADIDIKNHEPENKKGKSKSDEWYDEFVKLYVNDLEALVSKTISKTSRRARAGGTAAASESLLTSTYHIISGSGDAWYLEPLTKTFVKVQRGSEIAVYPGKPDERGRVLVRTLNTYLLIPKDEILNVGFN